jgi:hypothetical protein
MHHPLLLLLLLPVLTFSKKHNLLRQQNDPLPGTNPSTDPLGSTHRCSYHGKAYPVELSLTSRQLDNSEEFYYGKSRESDFYQHLFVASECTNNALPPSSHACFSTLRVGRHCGPDEDWSVIAPDEFDGPGVMWRNNAPCSSADEGVHKDEVAVVVDFFCPTEPECIHLHRCSFEGAPKSTTKKTPLLTSQSRREGTGNVNTNKAYKDIPEGYYEHVFTPEQCSNGLPPVAPSGGGDGRHLCMTSIRWAESCGGDHDWESFTTEDGGAAGIRWYTSHVCDRAKVAVDYYCPATTNEKDKETTVVHRCSFKGNSDVVQNKKNTWCELPNNSPTAAHASERHAGDPAPGFCLQHIFEESECLNGLPLSTSNCIASRKRLKECGQEQDFTIVGPTFIDTLMNNVDNTYEIMGRNAGIMWYNGLESGPCGEAELTVDYFCPKTI